jgi:hypothetical protein
MRTRGANLSQVGVPPPYAETWPIAIREVELDPPGYREVLVRIGAAGLCHSDLSVINRDPARGPCRWLSATRQRERSRRSGLGSMTSCAATMWSSLVQRTRRMEAICPSGSSPFSWRSRTIVGTT